jgi:uncharacterized protein YndB with AHSA1/START domain
MSRTHDLVSTRRALIGGSALAVAAIALRVPFAVAQATEAGGVAPTADGISHGADTIHQERVFKAERKRVYPALTQTAEFDKVIQLSGVMQLPFMAKMKEPTKIGRNAGSAFKLFGGYITGRSIELAPNELIVQAWRVGNWDRGVYSVARFQLIEQGAETKLIFDHTGFPQGAAEHLAAGWKSNYWDPLEKYLAAG